MATRAESHHAEAQRHGPTAKARKRAKATKKRAEKFGAPHPTEHAGGKASYALEVPSQESHASRKSTRSSANRAKPDANLNLREERAKGAPTNRSRKARARATRVRGSPVG
jgi:hypothetical protein